MGGVVRRMAVIVVVGALVTGCSGDGPSLSQAFCDDLASALTPVQILGGPVRDGTFTPEEAADRAYGMAAVSCPDQLRSNEALRQYLTNWGIDPATGDS